MVNHDKALNNYFIPRTIGENSSQFKQCNIRALYDGKAVCTTTCHITIFMYSDWIYKAWYKGLNSTILSCDDGNSLNFYCSKVFKIV